MRNFAKVFLLGATIACGSLCTNLSAGNDSSTSTEKPKINKRDVRILLEKIKEVTEDD